MANTVKPLPCLCGSDRVSVVWEGTIGGRWSYAQCKDCRAKGPTVKDWNDGATSAAWNKLVAA